MLNDIFKLVDGKFVISEGYGSIKQKDIEEYTKPNPNRPGGKRRGLKPANIKTTTPATTTAGTGVATQPSTPPADTSSSSAVTATSAASNNTSSPDTTATSTQPADTTSTASSDTSSPSATNPTAAAGETASPTPVADKQEQGAIGELLKNDGLQNTVNAVKSIEAWMTKNGLKLIPQAVQQPATQANPISERKIIRHPSLMRWRAK